jgi:hypothetical protein
MCNYTKSGRFISRSVPFVFSFSVFFSLMCFDVNAKDMGPLPIERQVRDSQAIIQGTFLERSYRLLPNDTVITQNYFKVKAGIGQLPLDMANKNRFLVITPGGLWEDLVYDKNKIVNFSSGQEIVLFLEKSDYGLTPLSESSGYYTLQQSLGGSFLKNSKFPNHAGSGKIRLDEFYSLVEGRYGRRPIVYTRNSGAYVFKENAGNQRTRLGRAPSSIDETLDDDEAELTPFQAMMWPLALLTFMGTLYRFAKSD